MKNLIGSKLLVGPLTRGQIVTYINPKGEGEFARIRRHFGGGLNHIDGGVYEIEVVDGDGAYLRKRVHRKRLYGPPDNLAGQASKFAELMSNVDRATEVRENAKANLLGFALAMCKYDGMPKKGKR